jgi:hypothetical protein
MFYVCQFSKENLYVMDCSEDYNQALVLRQELADARPSRWYEVIPQEQFTKLFH